MKEKNANQKLYVNFAKFFKDAIYLFCCQRQLKNILENYRFYRKSGNDAYRRGGDDVIASL